MTTGLQVFNASGQLVMDATQRLSRIIQTISLTGGVSGSFSDSRLTVTNVYWAYQRDKSFHLSAGYGGLMSPTFSFSGNTFSWSYAPLNNASYDEYAAGIVLVGAY